MKRLCVWYDPSQVATRNDRAADADMGFDKMAVSYNTWRRAHGFSEADAPDPKEFALRLIVSKGMVTPEMTEALLQAVAPEIMDMARETAQEATGAPIPPEIDALLEEASSPSPGGATDQGETTAEPSGTAPPLAEPEV